MAIQVEQLRAAVAAEMPQIVSDLESLVRIPSFANEEGPSPAVAQSAQHVLDLVKAAGLTSARIVQVPDSDGQLGGPAILAHQPGPPGAPTVLLYAHHDVQPVADDWSTDPFEPTTKDGRLFGRGTADDGAGVVTHLAVLRILRDRLPVGVVLLIEGEEEIGSPTFERILERYSDELRSDVAVVADSDNWAAGVPALTTSLRGLAELKVTLTVAEYQTHSGMFGGPVLDAALLMARLISTLHNDQGEVAVEGLAATGSSPVDYPVERFRREAGLLDSVQLAGSGSLADALWFKPAISVIGFDAPRSSQTTNAIQPSAAAVISLRVPPGADAQAAAEKLGQHLQNHVEFGAHLEIQYGASGSGFLADTSGPAGQAAKWALTTAFGQDVVQTGQGGSIPLANYLAQAFPGMEILITGMEDPSSRAHSGDESVDLGMLEKVVLAEVLLLERLATGGTAE
ncbi:MAG: dipeptidase [Micrococcales bacterium]|nr:dipeptidase [Micrococcales bacterium]